MASLTDDPELATNVDWISEAVSRFSDTVVTEDSLTDVRMDDLTRKPRVCARFLACRSSCNSWFEVGQNGHHSSPG